MIPQRLRNLVWKYYPYVKPAVRAAMLTAAWLWRRLMFRTTFIAITGSVGKTTAKEAIAAVLSQHFPTHRTKGSSNFYTGVSKSVLGVRPWHRYAVIEIGIDGPGHMAKFARVVRPDIAVWTHVKRAHTQSFKTLEVTASEKGRLISALRPGGLAVLNDDNEHIAAWEPPEGVRVVRYGLGPHCALRAENLSSNWPRTFSFDAIHDGEREHFETRMLGKHWISSLLPAIAIARDAGLTMPEAAQAMRKLEPPPLRVSQAVSPQGITFIRDERNGMVDSVTAAFDVMREASAPRKVIVFSDVTDSKQTVRQRMRRIAIEASQCADAVVFISDSQHHCVRAALGVGMPEDSVFGFYAIEEAAAHLKTFLRPGDLVLLRGRMMDHLSRIYLQMLGDVTCWKDGCKRKDYCDVCPELTTRGKRPDSGVKRRW